MLPSNHNPLKQQQRSIFAPGWSVFSVGPVGSEATSGSCTSGRLNNKNDFAKKNYLVPKKRPEMLSHTLQGTNISHPKALLEMICLFQLGYLSSLEGNLFTWLCMYI